MIQALVRWRSDDALDIYARLEPADCCAALEKDCRWWRDKRQSVLRRLEKTLHQREKLRLTLRASDAMLAHLTVAVTTRGPPTPTL